MCTNYPIIPRRSWSSYQLRSLIDCRQILQTTSSLRNLNLNTKKHCQKVAIKMSTSNTQKLIVHPKKEIEIATSSGSIHHIQKMYLQTLQRSFCPWFRSISRANTWENFSTRIMWRSAIAALIICVQSSTAIIQSYQSRESNQHKNVTAERKMIAHAMENASSPSLKS